MPDARKIGERPAFSRLEEAPHDHAHTCACPRCGVSHQDGPTLIGVGGMTQRQWYKGMAAQGLLNGAVGYIRTVPSSYAQGPCNAGIVDRACMLADALLADDAEHEREPNA